MTDALGRSRKDGISTLACGDYWRFAFYGGLYDAKRFRLDVWNAETQQQMHIMFHDLTGMPSDAGERVIQPRLRQLLSMPELKCMKNLESEIYAQMCGLLGNNS